MTRCYAKSEEARAEAEVLSKPNSVRKQYQTVPQQADHTSRAGSRSSSRSVGTPFGTIAAAVAETQLTEAAETTPEKPAENDPQLDV